MASHHRGSHATAVPGTHTAQTCSAGMLRPDDWQLPRSRAAPLLLTAAETALGPWSSRSVSPEASSVGLLPCADGTVGALSPLRRGHRFSCHPSTAKPAVPRPSRRSLPSRPWSEHPEQGSPPRAYRCTAQRPSSASALGTTLPLDARARALSRHRSRYRPRVEQTGWRGRGCRRGRRRGGGWPGAPTVVVVQLPPGARPTWCEVDPWRREPRGSWRHSSWRHAGSCELSPHLEAPHLGGPVPRRRASVLPSSLEVRRSGADLDR